MIATIGRTATVTSATFSRHIARAQDERKIQSCGVKIANGMTTEMFAIIQDTEMVTLIIHHHMLMKNIGARTEKGKNHDKERSKRNTNA